MKTVKERFYERVNKTSSCWLWIGPKSKKGYGVFNYSEGFQKHVVAAHRFAFRAFTGTAPGDLHVLHKCDVRACVNPDHLFTGTNYDNRQDCVKKGRGYGGERHHWAKVSDEMVEEIKIADRNNVPINEIAETYGLSETHTLRLIRGDYRMRTKLP